MCEGGKVGCVACWRRDYVLGLCCAAIQIMSDFHFVSTDCSINKLIHTFMIKTRISHVERTLLFPRPVGPISLKRSHALAALQWKSIRNDNIGRLRVIHGSILIFIFELSFDLLLLLQSFGGQRSRRRGPKMLRTAHGTEVPLV